MAYLVWRQGKYAELLHSYRTDEGKVRQMRVAYLGRSPVVTDELKARVAAEHPDIDVDWSAIEDAVSARTDAVPGSAEPSGREGVALKRVAARPMLWAFFESMRRGLLQADEPLLWDRPAPPPRRRPGYSAEEAQERLWPVFVRIMETRPDLPELLRNPEALAEAVRSAYRRAETEAAEAEARERAPRPPKNEPKAPRLGYDEALRMLGLPWGVPLRIDDVRRAFEEQRGRTESGAADPVLEEAREAALEYVRTRAWR